MTDVTYDRVARRLINRDGTSREGLFLWRFEHQDGRAVRRTLIDLNTGEIIDDTWIDAEGRITTYTRPRLAGDG